MVTPAQSVSQSQTESRSARLSEPVEALLIDPKRARVCDVLIIGSGYGGSIAALELADKDRKVWVFERGREYALGQFPETIGALPSHVQVSRPDDEQATGYPDALFDVRIGDGASVLVGCGLGGGSLINASVVLDPDRTTLDDSAWPPELKDGCNPLSAYFDEARSLLGAEPFGPAATLAKLEALKRLGACELVPIAVTSKAGRNSVGVHQDACTLCGNCVTGCNVGAKNTLPMNVIPLAKTRHAHFFTGAYAQRILRPSKADRATHGSGPRWKVRFARTSSLSRGRTSDTFDVLAHTVIIAAGTLGSTELLLRSRTEQLQFSSQLGQRFSGNADAIAFGYGQRRAVHSVAAVHQDDSGSHYKRVGPTIVAAVRNPAGGTGRTRFLIEDASVPYALSSLIGSLMGALAFPHRFVRANEPAFFQDCPAVDPISTPAKLNDHLQVLLSMGFDRGVGQLRLHPKHRRLTIHMAGATDDACHTRLHDYLRTDVGKRFDEGYYVPNPTWRPLPDDLAQLAGPVDSSLLTVHPLGGCAMGRSAHDGVVDHLGRVFDASCDANYAATTPPAVHAGLHVLDGAVIPMPLGVNPLLTICAVSMRAARTLSRSLDACPTKPTNPAKPTSSAKPAKKVRVQWAEPRRSIQAAPKPPSTASLGFTEVLRTSDALDIFFDAERLAAADPPQSVDLKLDVALDPDQWLADPSRPWTGTASVYPNKDPAGRRPYRKDQTLLGTDALVLPALTGQVTARLLEADRPRGDLRRRWRQSTAVLSFVARRGVSELFAAAPAKPGERKTTLCRRLQLFWRAARVHTVRRVLDYRIELQDGSTRRIKICGRKLLAFKPGSEDPWTTLLELPATIRELKLRHGSWLCMRKRRIELRVDALDLLKRRVYQLTETNDTPAGIAQMLGVSAFWMRALLSTHYWSFRGLDYGRQLPRVVPGNVVYAHGHAIVPEVIPFEVPRPKRVRESMMLALTRYRQPDCSDRVILLTHGLAHGGEIFTTDTVPKCLVAYLVEKNYDVWVLDNRMSNRLSDWKGTVDVPREPSSLDDIAQFDIPRAVDIVCRITGQAKISVLAHCMGAAAMSMAILSGRLSRAPRDSRIERLILHAVSPWMVPSNSSRASALIATVFGDLLGDQILETVPPKTPGPIDQLVDRIGSSIGWDKKHRFAHHLDVRGDAMGTAICNRLTLFYGRQWLHENLDPRTHQQLYRLVGPAHVSFAKQAYFFALRQRLTDREGGNVYLTEQSVEAYWTFPTLLACGTGNKVFAPEGNARSYRILKSLGRDVSYLPVAGIGHLDFFLGKHAHLGKSRTLAGSGIFDALDAFLRGQPQDAQTMLSNDQRAAMAAPDLEQDASAVTGPSFTYDCLPGGKIRLNVWVELRSHVTGHVRAPVRFRIEFAGGRSRPMEGDCIDLGATWRQLAPMGRYLLASVKLTRAQLKAATALRIDTAFNRRFLQYTRVRVVPHRNQVCLDLQPLQIASARHQAALRCPISRYLQESTPEPVADPKQQAADAVTLDLAQPWRDALCDAPNPCPRSGHPAPSVQRARGRYTILATSCRWPGAPFENKAASRIVEQMCHQVGDRRHGQTVDAVWLLGDQIYADALGGLESATETAERAGLRYREAFSGDQIYDQVYPSAAMRTLMRRVPVWMIVDDHELSDNWDGIATGKPISRDDRLRVAAFTAYQWRRRGAPPDGGLPFSDNDPKRGFWQSFHVGHLPVFALDTRTERTGLARTDRDWGPGALWTRRLLSTRQMRAFTAWLRSFKSDDCRPKFVLSGSVFGFAWHTEEAPQASLLDKDDWSGFPASARCVATAIATHKVKNLIFVSGDYHLSAYAQVCIRHVSECGVRTSAVVHSIVASGMNATLPFANTAAWELEIGGVARPLPFGSNCLDVHSTARLLSLAPRQFSRISVSSDDGNHWKLSIQVFDDTGQPCLAAPVQLALQSCPIAGCQSCPSAG